MVLTLTFGVKAAMRAVVCNEGRSQKCLLPGIANTVCKCHPMAEGKMDWLLVSAILGKI